MVNTNRPVSDINPAASTELSSERSDALNNDVLKSSLSTDDRTTHHDLDYDRDYRGAYEVGYKNRPLFDSDTHFEQVEPELQSQWEGSKGQSRLNWEQAKYAAKDAWLRAHR